MRAVRGGRRPARRALRAASRAVHALCSADTPCRRRTRSRAGDLSARVLRYRDGFRGDSAFTTWLYRVAYNVCHEHWRQDRRDAIHAPNARLNPSGNSRGTGERAPRPAEQAMARLEPEQRAVPRAPRAITISSTTTWRACSIARPPRRESVRTRALNDLREIYRELEQRQHELRPRARIDRR